MTLNLRLLLLCYYITLVSCQQCLSLNGSSTCDMFPAAKISIRGNVSLPWLVNVSTVAEFDRQLLDYVNSTAFWDLELGCTTATIHNRARFAVSFTCATIVFDNKSSICNPDSLLIPLCQSSCDSYLKSVQAILAWSSSDTVCPLTTTRLSQQCQTNEGLKGMPSTGCVSAADHEISMCGFGNDVDTLCQYCNVVDSTLSCCYENNCFSRKPALLNGGVIAGIVSGIVTGLLLLCVACFIRQRKKRSTCPNDAMCTKETLSVSMQRRNTFQIEDEDYMQVLPQINLETDSIKGHVFKVNSLEKQFVRVIYPMKSPANPDELELLKNDIIRMYYYFDDGWAFGDNLGSGLRGLFPILCVVNLTAEEVYELLYLSRLSDDTVDQESGDYYDSSVRYFSTGVQYDLDPRATLRLQNLRRTLTLRHTPPSEDNNFHYLCTLSPPPRTASMHAAFQSASVTKNRSKCKDKEQCTTP